MSGQFTETTGTLNVRINGEAFATITTNGTTTTITRNDGTPLSDDEVTAMDGVFAIQASAFTSFDQMLAPVGGFFQ
jgi:flagellar basal body rod protein FlgG